ncbi:putative GTP1/OBG domain superfamily protein [Helianthus annuus]|nr:putative GTP1/OBG domain superfamily protein [Helianthus annuus]
MLTGTVVEHKRGKFLYDLAQHGDKILVARGGQGGISLLEMSEHKKKKMMNMTSNVMTDENDKVKDLFIALLYPYCKFSFTPNFSLVMIFLH